jgi:hypothetical protein
MYEKLNVNKLISGFITKKKLVFKIWLYCLVCHGSSSEIFERCSWC